MLLGALALAKRESSLWSLQPVQLPPIPRPAGGTKWVRNPIDAFVLAKLEANGLKPAPEADKRTLIRRVTFDLTGRASASKLARHLHSIIRPGEM